MTADLLAFLRARLDEDAADARRAAVELGPRWRYDGQHVIAEAEGDMVATGSLDELEAERGAHIARHDPTRVLAEVEAARVLIAQYEGLVDAALDGFTGVFALGAAIRAKAAVYAEHPDYDESWRP